VTIIVNGERRDVADGSTVGSLIEQLGVRRDGIAVACNDDVIARTSIDTTLLCEGDTLEIIVAVAGG